MPTRLRNACFAALGAAVLAAGCGRFEPRPLDPARNEGDFRARSLADPGLGAYLEARLRPRPAALPPGAWDLASLTLVAFYGHPDLEVARARSRAAAAEVQSAGARENPSLNLEAERSANPPLGESPWVLGFGIALPIETAGKRGLRQAQAVHLGEAARLELGETAWQVRSRLRGALVDHLLARREAELLDAEVQVRSEAVRLMEDRYRAGEVSRPEVDLARTELASARLASIAAQGRIRETLAVLAERIGLPAQALDGALFVWPDLERPPSADSLPAGALQRAGLLNRLDVRGALAEYAAAQSALQLELARRYPDLDLGPGYTFDQDQNKLTLGLGVVLPLLNRNSGPIAAAEARREEAGARLLAVQAAGIAAEEQARARYASAGAELEAARQLGLLLEEQAQSLRRALELGSADRLALVGVRVQAAVAARAAFEAARQAQEALGALEDALQTPLWPALELPEVSSRSPRLEPAGAPERSEERRR